MAKIEIHQEIEKRCGGEKKILTLINTQNFFKDIGPSICHTPIFLFSILSPKRYGPLRLGPYILS
jgi:hypothetical protein